MPTSKIIGGEHEIDINYLSLPVLNTFEGIGKWYSSGRSALYAILKTIQRGYNVTKVLIPEYNCESVVATVMASGLKYELYGISSDLGVDLDSLFRLLDSSCVIILNNYFGLLDLKDNIELIKRKYSSCIVIEDDVQAFYYYKDREQVADYSFTSLRKWFAIPDGGLAKAKKGNLLEFSQSASFPIDKMCGLVLKSMRGDIKDCDRVYMQLLEAGEMNIDNELLSTASIFSRKIYQRLNLDNIAKRRVANSEYVKEGLSSLGISPIHNLENDSVPLFVPILLNNRNKVRKALFSNEIFCPVHWPCESIDSPLANYMATHELSIIIDQRYGIKDMERILNIIADNL